MAWYMRFLAGAGGMLGVMVFMAGAAWTTVWATYELGEWAGLASLVTWLCVGVGLLAVLCGGE